MSEELTKEEKALANRVVNANFMAGNLKVLTEDMEYFRGEYKSNEKNVFNRIIRNAEILFDTSKMSPDVVAEVEKISDAIIDSNYELRKQYRKHIVEQIIKSRSL